MAGEIQVVIAIKDDMVTTNIQSPPDAYLATYLAVGRCVKELSQRRTEVPHFNYEVGPVTPK